MYLIEFRFEDDDPIATPAKEGESTTFEIRVHDDMPFDSYEIYASAW